MTVPIANGEALLLTITLDLAQVGEEEDISSTIKRFDGALHEGKRAGRNRYVMANP
jgi:diguanylate cyclase